MRGMTTNGATPTGWPSWLGRSPFRCDLVNLRNYIVVTGAYWGFTVTDGALRMLVLLHFFLLGFSPVQLAFLFLFYEFFGVVTNLLGGWLGSQVGLRGTLIGGLFLQVADRKSTRLNS